MFYNVYNLETNIHLELTFWTDEICVLVHIMCGRQILFPCAKVPPPPPPHPPRHPAALPRTLRGLACSFRRNSNFPAHMTILRILPAEGNGLYTIRCWFVYHHLSLQYKYNIQLTFQSLSQCCRINGNAFNMKGIYLCG